MLLSLVIINFYVHLREVRVPRFLNDAQLQGPLLLNPALLTAPCTVDQEECVNQFLEQCGDVPIIKNTHSPMANKHQILVNDTPLDGEVVHK